MGKKKRRHINLMRDWPHDDTCGVPYEDLIHPLKKIIYEGYKVERTATNQFTYTGYNIGENERRYYYPTPEERFHSRWLDNERKMKRTLMDNVLITVFQLGLEQGRRLNNTQNYANSLLEDILAARTQTIKNLRAKLAEYDPAYKEDVEILSDSDNDDLLIDSLELNDVDV